MQILSVDNFNRDYETEYVIATGIEDAELALRLARSLNEKFSGDNAPRFYVIREDAYVPYVFSGY